MSGFGAGVPSDEPIGVGVPSAKTSGAALRADTVDALLREVAEVQSATRQPSLVVGVVRSGALVWTSARGRHAGDTAAGPDLQYRIGSLTKTMTAIAVLQCRDEGLLDLDAPIGSMLSDETPFAATPIRRLLSHSGGLPAEPEGPWWERHDGSDFDDLAARVGKQELVLPAGQRFHYSNLAYGLLGELVGRLRGTSWWDVVRTRLLKPIGMRRTTYSPTTPHAQGYSVHPWSGRLDEEPHTDTGAMAPAGQLWSTVEDLARYAAFWLDPDPAVLAPATAEEMRIPVGGGPDSGLDMAWGLGLELSGGTTRFGHGGSMPGFLACLAIDPDERIAAVTLSNGTRGGTPTLAHTLLDIVAEREPRLSGEWVPEPTIDGADELLGPWYWGNTPFTLVVRDGMLMLDAGRPARSSRLEPVGHDEWRGRDAYFAGESLRVVRREDGTISHLDLATYTLTRTPNSP
ncbi:MAG TPA: serine hydrolase domain-containing protein [Nocardioidaceae bacterium]|nr:serine hydrolase domain-containing protein [Nocardioidaceae bacterium]